MVPKNVSELPPELFSDNPVPPHDGTGHEHDRGRESGKSPDQLRGLVAEPGTAAGNPYSVNAAEMQVGEPIDDLINDAVFGIGGGKRLEPVGEVLKRLRVAEVSPA